MADPLIELETTGVASGGDALAREPSGRVVFVRGALPGERVRVRMGEQRRDYARGEVVEVLQAAPGRTEEPCPFVEAGCGGCDLQWVTPEAQRDLKVQIVADALRRLGKIRDPQVHSGPVLPAEAYRTTVRCLVHDGRAAYRRRASHEPVDVDSCLVAHPLLDELIGDGRFGAAREITLRAGARTGERLVVARPTAEGVVVPDDVTVVGEDELSRGRRAWYHEEVAGRRWRISARAFFQVRPDGAEALVELVRDALEGMGEPSQREAALVDACAGGGLFSGAVGAELPGAQRQGVLALERSASAVADARVNLEGLPVTVVRTELERWRPRRAAAVVADPSREGLGRRGVEVISGTRARRVVLVSCDAGALGRDAGLLVSAGYELRGATLVDLFPHTSHLEVVSRFDRL